MTRKHLLWLAVVPLSLFGIADVAAQSDDQGIPERPELPESADTNNATDYYNWGVSIVAKNPARAANAFYWASRLSPNWAAPLYARRVALLIDLPANRLIGYMEGRKSVLRSDEILAIDSLELRALMMEPLFFRSLDRELILAYWEKKTQREVGHDVSPNRVRYYLQSVLRQNVLASDEWNAWLAYNDRRFEESLDLYAKALRRTKNPVVAHTQRGRIFYELQQYDSAQASFRQAIDILRQEDDEELVGVYQSKAMLEYATGVVLEVAGDIEGAQEAHSRALMEDLAFYPAHLRLAKIAVNRGDTAQAIAELELAAQIQPNEVTPLLALSVVLRDAGQFERAAEVCERAIAVEPYYALPYLLHGSLLETVGDGLGALQRYREFVVRASGVETRLAWVNSRIHALRFAMNIPTDS